MDIISGRIHSAFVSAINFDLKTATVEWYEQGETKGKEIEMAVIESLNPEVIILNPQDVQPQTHHHQLQQVKIEQAIK